MGCKRSFTPRGAWRLPFLLALGVASCVERRASAEEASPREPSQSAPDAALLRARERVAEAETLFLAGHYAAALAEYTRAHEALAGHPRQYWVLHNLAACNERLFRYDVALKLYEEYLRRAPPTEGDRGEVAATIETLRSLLATLVVTSNTPAEVWVDDRRLGTAPGTWVVPAGRHGVELRAPYHEAERRELALDPGKEKRVAFTLRRLATYEGPSPAYFWVAVGLAGAAATAGTVSGIMAVKAHDAGRERAAWHLDTSDQAASARRWALASDACFGGAFVMAGAATILYFMTDWRERPRGGVSGPSLSSRLPTVSVGLGGVSAALATEF